MTPRPKRVVLVAAVADNGVIGRGGDIPWAIPEDLKHFRATTQGNTVLMGRATYDSIGRPLPFRSNVVVTRNRDWSAEHVFVAHSVADGIELAQGFEGDVMVIGGGTDLRRGAAGRGRPGAHRGAPVTRGRHPLPRLRPGGVERDASRAPRRLRLRLARAPHALTPIPSADSRVLHAAEGLTNRAGTPGRRVRRWGPRGDSLSP